MTGNDSTAVRFALFLTIGFGLLMIIGVVSGRDLPNGFQPGSVTDPMQCSRDLMDWCNDQDFTMDHGISSMNYQGTEDIFSLSCTTSSSGGVRCMKGNTEWFHCRPDNVFVLSGRQLSPNSMDREACSVRNQYFNAVYNQKQQNENFRHEMKNFERQMNTFKKRMDSMFSTGFFARRPGFLF